MDKSFLRDARSWSKVSGKVAYKSAKNDKHERHCNSRTNGCNYASSHKEIIQFCSKSENSKEIFESAGLFRLWIFGSSSLFRSLVCFVHLSLRHLWWRWLGFTQRFFNDNWCLFWLFFIR